MELAQAQKFIARKFYLTGGTALAEFYLLHRLSEDIDLFSEEEVNPSAIESFLQTAAHKLGVSKVVKQNYLGLYTYILQYANNEKLKVDFNYYPFPKVEKGMYFKNLEVSSMYDIAVNKIHTITSRSRVRDYIDLYLIFKQVNLPPLEYLRKIRIDSQAKFDWPLEVKNLVAALLKVKDLKAEDFPKMLVPLNRQDMEKFFLNLAKSLESDIFKS